MGRCGFGTQHTKTHSRTVARIGRKERGVQLWRAWWLAEQQAEQKITIFNITLLAAAAALRCRRCSFVAFVC